MTEAPGAQNLRRRPLSGPCKCLTLVLALRFALHKVLSLYLLPMNKHGSSDLGGNSLQVVVSDVFIAICFSLL